MSSSSITNTALFLGFCSAATAYHIYSQVVSWASRRTPPPTVDDAKKKVVVISGCDSGFGHLLAKTLYQESDYIVIALALTDQGVQSLESYKEDQKGTKDKLFVVRCDVTSDSDVQKVGEFSREILRNNNAVLYAIVNNAGISSAGDFVFFGMNNNNNNDNNNLGMYQKVMNVNFFGYLRLTQTLLPFMLETSPTMTEYPRIINMSSVCGIVSSAANSTYTASKFAIEAWSDSIRLELEPFHIKVIKIRPGQFNTQIQRNWATSYMENFAKAPPSIQALYGGDKFVANVTKVLDGMGTPGNESPPEIVVEALVRVLKSSHHALKASYLIGTDAQVLWRAFHSLPTAVSDTIKQNMMRFKYPVLSAD